MGRLSKKASTCEDKDMVGGRGDRGAAVTRRVVSGDDRGIRDHGERKARRMVEKTRWPRKRGREEEKRRKKERHLEVWQCGCHRATLPDRECTAIGVVFDVFPGQIHSLAPAP